MGKREKIQLTGPSIYIIASILPIYYLIFELSIEYLYYGSSHRRCSVKKSCSAGLQLYEKETPTQVIFCEICEFYKNNYFEEHLRTTASFTNTPICSLKFIFQTSSRVSQNMWRGYYERTQQSLKKSFPTPTDSSLIRSLSEVSRKEGSILPSRLLLTRIHQRKH